MRAAEARAEHPVLKRLPRPSQRPSEQPGLREVMAQFATGVTVLTSAGDAAHGMTANAFSSVSIDPPMVLCCVSRAARMHASIVSAKSFAVSMLGADQRELARYFADWRRPGGLAQFDSVDWTAGPCTEAPLLTGALAWLECELRQVYEGGDHSIFLGEVVSASRGTGREALVFFGGGYHPVTSQVRGATA
ncbi:flavin reductase family protein [Amycolatopsis nigrescens]|uniref:flavin reductase family protein n=1 Tax=Amycolatopsis nigrescens TaxID=381445 RepID=UPI0003669F67|nr:flavin reductase family protein [Amycolatopsis nigrescens]